MNRTLVVSPFAAALLLPWLAAAATAQLPPVPVPVENPITPAKVVLGKILFWDEQLSSDDSVACGTCHVPEAGGSDPRAANALHPGPDGLFGTADDRLGSIGIARQAANGDFAPSPLFGLRRQATPRTAGTTHGAAFHAELFWDGRASTTFVDPETQQVAIAYDGALESQAIAPILSDVEMGRQGRTWNDVRTKLLAVRPLALATRWPADTAQALAQHPDYASLFTAAFGDPAITAKRIAFALASYERTLIPDATPWDAFTAGNTNALTPAQQTGWQIFQGSGRCIACHWTPWFQDDLHHVLGLHPAAEDPGRFAVTQVSFDLGAFKTPSLRNAGLRPRLFHDGSSPPLGSPGELADPRSTLNVYFHGGGPDRSNLDPFLIDLSTVGVTIADLLLVQDFVKHGLTDPRAANALPPFDRPRLFSETSPPRTFGSPLAGTFAPYLADAAPPFLGNADWKLGLCGGDGAGLGFLAFATSSIEPAASLGGVPLHVGPALDGLFVPLRGVAGTPGYATWRLAVPAAPGLAGVSVFFQLFAQDAGSPLGVAASGGWQFTVR